ncbi:hypothetical protein [Smaragdicoccus niigatensis]|uniref:hypothetical protein n=1 Tax=Smaragdicoccus niigatensis TaxID=359359 RepID=UPI000685881B|nr:hypothetical protein [Smaragdicoccus niigatensis]
MLFALLVAFWVSSSGADADVTFPTFTFPSVSNPGNAESGKTVPVNTDQENSFPTFEFPTPTFDSPAPSAPDPSTEAPAPEVPNPIEEPPVSVQEIGDVTISGNPPEGFVSVPYSSGPFTCTEETDGGTEPCAVANDPSDPADFHPGLAFAGNSLTGSPTQSGTYTVVVCADISGQEVLSHCTPFSFAVSENAQPSISGDAPDACLGTFYRYAYSGTDFDSFSVAGILPPGILSSSSDTDGSGRPDTVVLSGIPLIVGTYPFTITVSGGETTDSVSDSITITDCGQTNPPPNNNPPPPPNNDPQPPPPDNPPADNPPADNPPADNPPADNPPADNPPADNPPGTNTPPGNPPAATTPSSTGLQTASTSVSQGGTVQVNGFGCTPGAKVTLTSEGQELGTAVASDKGEFSATADVSGLDVGRHVITASCGTVLTAPIDIVLTSRAGSGATAIVIVFFTALSALLYRPRFFRPSDRNGASS